MAGRRFAAELSPDRVSVWVRGDGVILEEPAVAAVAEESGRVQAWGSQAPRQARDSRARLVRPFAISELTSPEAAAQVVRMLTTRAVGRLTFARPEMVLTVSAELSTSARRVLLEAALATGARMAHLLDLPLAMAFGAGLPVTAWEPSPVLFLLPQGAQAAVVCHHGLLIHEAVEVELPNSATGPEADAPVQAVSELLERILEDSPEPARAGIRRQGFALAGRGVDLNSWRDQLVRRRGIPMRVVPDPEDCVVKGAEVALERIEGSGARALLYLR